MKELSTKEALESGISTYHNEMDNGEKRFRLSTQSGSLKSTGICVAEQSLPRKEEGVLRGGKRLGFDGHTGKCRS